MVGAVLSFNNTHRIKNRGVCGFSRVPSHLFRGNSTNKEATILGYLFSIEWKMVEGRIFEMISRICSGSEENKNADSTYSLPGMNE